MKKLIIACLGIVSVAPLANAAVLYNTMDDLDSIGYDDFLSPYVKNDGTVVDDVNFAKDVNLSGFSCYLLSDKPLDTGDINTLNGSVLIRQDNGGIPDAILDITGVTFDIVSASGGTGPLYRTLITLNQSIAKSLDAGTYWFGVQIYTDSATNFYIAGSDLYGQNQNAMTRKNGTWQKWDGLYSGTGDGTDLSFKIEGNEVNGEPTVPGPAAIVPFGIGLASALRRRRK